MDDVNIAYLRGALSAEQIQDEITTFFGQIGISPEISAELDAVGLDRSALSGLPANSIDVHIAGSGADPASTLLIIVFAPIGNVDVVNGALGASSRQRIVARLERTDRID